MIFNIIFRASIRNSVPNFCLCVGGNVPCSLHDPSISCQEKTDFKAKRCPSILSVIHPLSNASSALLVLSSASLFQRLFIRPPCLLLRFFPIICIFHPLNGILLFFFVLGAARLRRCSVGAAGPDKCTVYKRSPALRR